MHWVLKFLLFWTPYMVLCIFTDQSFWECGHKNEISQALMPRVSLMLRSRHPTKDWWNSASCVTWTKVKSINPRNWVKIRFVRCCCYHGGHKYDGRGPTKPHMKKNIEARVKWKHIIFISDFFVSASQMNYVCIIWGFPPSVLVHIIRNRKLPRRSCLPPIFSWVWVLGLQWLAWTTTLGLVLNSMVCWFISEQDSTQVAEFGENV